MSYVNPPRISAAVYNQALTLLALAHGQKGRARWASLRKAASIRRWFVKWARHAPANYAQKHHLLEAEYGRVLGRSAEEVVPHYEQAIQLARENRYIQDEALAHELVALYFLGRGLRTLATGHMVEAHQLFQRWGATAHVALLKQRYPTLLSPAPSGPIPRLPGG